MSAEDAPKLHLTSREREVLRLARAGLTNAQIAAELRISHNAVRYHLKELHSKLYTGGERDTLVSRARRLVFSMSVLRPAILAPVSTAVTVGALSVAAIFSVIVYTGGVTGNDSQETTVDESADWYCVAELATRASGNSVYPEALQESCFETRAEVAAFYDSIEGGD